MTISIPADAERAWQGRSGSLDRLFAPRSVAFVGASDRSSWSHLVHQALGYLGFDGAVHYVNPRGGTAHGHELATSLAGLSEVPDAAFVMVAHGRHCPERAPPVIGETAQAATNAIMPAWQRGRRPVGRGLEAGARHG